MNICHITKAYGLINNKTISVRQNRLADAGLGLAYTEMGIYNYPAEGEDESQLRARMKGISASVTPGDFVFIQLPSGNGIKFEIELMRTIHSIPDTKIILLWHSMGYYVEHKDELSIFADYDCEPSAVCNTLDKSQWHMQKLLTDAIAQVCLLSELRNSSTNEIHIGMGVYDRNGTYTSWAGVAIQSIAEHTNAKLHFHLLHDNTMTELNRLRLMYICNRHGHCISFHSIDANVLTDLSDHMQKYTIGALFRILLPDICSDLSRIIYLDSDLLINCDIKELWDTDIRNYCLAAVPDEPVVKGIAWTKPTSAGQIARETYFNSGVLYMNLDKIRTKGNLCEMVSCYLKENPDSNLPDQDALNVIFNRDTLLIDPKWNTPIELNRFKGNTSLHECIYHYIGTLVAPYVGGEIDRLYMDTAKRTPWGIAFYESLLKRSLNRQNVQIRNLEKIFTILSEGNKKLIFYGEENASMKKLYELLNAQNHESYRVLKVPDNGGIISCRDFDFLKNLERNSFIVFVLYQADHAKALNYLNEIGLEMEKDYFVIQNIMDYKDGGYLV